MLTGKTILGWILGVVIGLSLIFGGFIVLIDLHLSTTQGQHTGVITATEQSGLFFRTWDVYVKTSAMSTQENTYCAIDPKVISELQAAQTSQEQVTISYSIPHWIEMRQCGISGGINGIISAVNPVK